MKERQGRANSDVGAWGVVFLQVCERALHGLQTLSGCLLETPHSFWQEKRLCTDNFTQKTQFLSLNKVQYIRGKYESVIPATILDKVPVIGRIITSQKFIMPVIVQFKIKLVSDIYDVFIYHLSARGQEGKDTSFLFGYCT